MNLLQVHVNTLELTMTLTAHGLIGGLKKTHSENRHMHGYSHDSPMAFQSQSNHEFLEQL